MINGLKRNTKPANANDVKILHVKTFNIVANMQQKNLKKWYYCY